MQRIEKWLGGFEKLLLFIAVVSGLAMMLLTSADAAGRLENLKELVNAAAEAAGRDEASPVPLHLRNAPTSLMKSLEYGKGYRYAHDEAKGVADMDCLPPNLEGRTFYEPKPRGYEKEIKRRLDGWTAIKKARRT
mgnify:CR=1 FL=1